MKYTIFSLIISILVLAGCNSNNTSQRADSPVALRKSATAETIPKNWYLRIVAEDTTNNMKTAGAQLGQLEVSDAVTKHTLLALAPLKTTFLDVVFVNPLGVAQGEYTTNFHLLNTGGDSWDFTVKDADVNANIILSMRGIYVLSPYIDTQGRQQYKEYISASNPLLARMKLIDVSTNKVIPVDNNGTTLAYVFNMSGVTSKQFQWVLQATPVIVPKLSKQAKMLNTLEVQALRKDAKATPQALTKKRIQSIDMQSPPKFEVLVK